MPNKRKQGKKIVSTWLEQGDANEFDAIAESLGLTRSELLTIIIREEIKRKSGKGKGK